MMTATTFLADHATYVLAFLLSGIYIAHLVIANLSAHRKQRGQWADVESRLQIVGVSRGPFLWIRRFTSAILYMHHGVD